MASTGKKINELTALSTVSDQTVLPAVYVDGSTTATTATKIAISQISTKVQNDMSSALSAKQDNLVSGSNIKTVNGQSILGSGNLAVTTYQEFNSSWPTTTTFAAFLSAINSDNTATAGMAYMGDLQCTGLPEELPSNANVEAVVEIMNSTTGSKAIHVTLTSGTTSPNHWEYTYWNNGSSVSGWLSWQPKLPAGTTGYYLQKTASGVQWAEVQGGGSGAPTLNWFSGNTGAYVDTQLDLSSANLIKVYKNGILLEPDTETRTIYSYTGVGGGYLILNSQPPLDTADTWSIDLHFSNWVPVDFAWPFGNSVVTDFTTPGLGYEKNKLHLFLTSEAGSWSIADTNISPSSTPATGDVRIRVSFDGSSYKLQYKDVNNPVVWVTSENILSSAKTYMGQDATLKFLGRANGYSCVGSTLVLNDLVITIDGQEWFNGENNRSNITNYGCTETTETISGGNDYSISGSTIYFATNLTSTDKIAVEVF